MERQSTPLFLRFVAGLGLAVALVTTTIRAEAVHLPELISFHLGAAPSCGPS